RPCRPHQVRQALAGVHGCPRAGDRGGDGRRDVARGAGVDPGCRAAAGRRRRAVGVIGDASRRAGLAVATRGRALALETRERLTFLAFIAPNFLLFGVFVFWPLLFAVYLSLHDWNIIAPVRIFVGLENFQELLADKL